MTPKGQIRNRAQAQRIRDFTGLRWGNITPTDIDGFLEFGDRLFVFIEAKFGGSQVPGGQMLAMARLVDACHCPPRRYAVAFIVDHFLEDVDVDYAQTTVRAYRWGGEWRRPLQPTLTLHSAIERLRKLAMPVWLASGGTHGR